MPRDQVPSANVPLNDTLALVTAGAEQPYVINVGTEFESVKKVQFKSRTTADSFQYSYTMGGPYTTVPGGQTYFEFNLDIHQALNAYFVGSVNGQVIEIEIWR